MAATGLNKKSPTIKRIMREAAELTSNPSPDYHAAPLDSDLFEWHFTLRGPADSPFSAGIYHGRITLPPQYPLRPPSFRFLTPSGRFECNREICLSISGFHEETWQPAWGIRTAILALRSHMDAPAKGQVGGVESDDATRRRLAETSRSFTCQVCGRSNKAILDEQELLAKQNEEARDAKRDDDDKDDGDRRNDNVPEELRLVYKEDLKPREKSDGAEAEGKEAQAALATPAQQPVRTADASAPGGVTARAAVQNPSQAAVQRAHSDAEDIKLDAAIWVVSALLVLLLARMATRLFL
ncbi:uncharacterized protein PV09_05223 [Verruconis gallopava]|uniref:UBC core domain-containing protein n=1 Tax=Verruconis gallopava TaxID=253628 RepID=A0A0D2A9N7_9PEZI|nr:uncharacterized protein PV09_05223 [Verruconis gallopava]KIW03453.1 hypothetical protein PV09_05223 [Verruconis gallopava]